MADAKSFRPGVRLGVDVGSVRVGVAKSDHHGILATPVATITGEKPGTFHELLTIVDQEQPVEIIIGLPRSLSGKEGIAATTARSYAVELSRLSNVDIRVVDERLTTVTAHSAMHASGRKGRKHRQVVDQVAAVMILQNALEIEHNTGSPAGELIYRNSVGEES